MQSQAQPALLEVDRLTKKFGELVANDAITFHINAGESVGILGENGAGKSTLMNMISGLLKPDDGEVRINGQVVQFESPRDAAAVGIGMVHQHFKLVGRLTVAENLALGDPVWGRGRLRLRELIAEVAPIAERLGITVDFNERVDRLTVGQQQRVEILKVLARRPKLLILDEPTAVLTREERPALFRLVEELVAQGTAVVLISHKMEDILDACSRVVVLRQGRVVSVSEVAGKTHDDLIHLLVGDSLPALKREKVEVEPRALLKSEALTVYREDGTLAAEDVSFTLRSGEVLALCGVDGNGQTELIEVLAGLRRPSSGEVEYWFQSDTKRLGDAYDIRVQGVCHIPEDRLRDGVFVTGSLADNFLLTRLDDKRFNRWGNLRNRPLRQAVAAAVDQYSVRTPGLDATLAQLSGGNQQKLVLARELGRNPLVVLAAHPTRGLDVQTIAFVNNQLLACRARGAGVLLLCSDLSEAWQMADRIMVMSAGRLYGPVPIEETTTQEVGQWMTRR